jgi:hypothetical protein
VAVHSFRGSQIGYLSAEHCGWVGGKIKQGRTCAPCSSVRLGTAR